ncbi:MAG: hypothetical protein CMG63_01990 [Candidatus Marinimicrobia bacterium]|nr:hypothetical protein [Candidatus Neomarinimicrobiota bacterium]|tara:strand:+ start:82 stop:567 length:486 start_codon:yes stop_codon:yes gene_type:complete
MLSKTILRKILIYSLFFSFLVSQTKSSFEQVRKIRLENFEKNYQGKTIKFTTENSKMVQGTLVSITEEDLILSIDKSAMFYNHKNINTVYLPPDTEDFYITASFTILGSLAGCLAMVAALDKPNPKVVGTATGLGTVLGFIVGKNAFYKSQKIDISGRLRE